MNGIGTEKAERERDFTASPIRLPCLVALRVICVKTFLNWTVPNTARIEKNRTNTVDDNSFSLPPSQIFKNVFLDAPRSFISAMEGYHSDG